MQIRASRPDDVERCIEIWCSSVDATHDFLTPEDRIAIEAQVRSFLPEAPLWLAVSDDDNPLGFMLVNEAHIEALFVHADMRGKGVGTELLNHARLLRPELTVDVNEQNAGARSFYRSYGFVETGRRGTDDEGRPYPIISMRLG